METEGVSNGAFEQLIRDETYLNCPSDCVGLWMVSRWQGSEDS